MPPHLYGEGQLYEKLVFLLDLCRLILIKLKSTFLHKVTIHCSVVQPLLIKTSLRGTQIASEKGTLLEYTILSQTHLFLIWEVEFANNYALSAIF